MLRPKADVDPAVRSIVTSGQEFPARIVGGGKPAMETRCAASRNRRPTPKKAPFDMPGRSKQRTRSVSTFKTFAQTLRMIALSKERLKTGDRPAERDACDESPQRFLP